MKQLIALSGFALALGILPAPALAQSSPPPLPQLSQQRSQELQARVDAYRNATDARVARGEITADEAARLTQWREWQIAQQLAATAAAPVANREPPVYDEVPPDYYDTRPRDFSAYEAPPPVYAPYYRYPAPYYWGPRPYAYWGPSICAGGFGRHFGGRVCF